MAEISEGGRSRLQNGVCPVREEYIIKKAVGAEAVEGEDGAPAADPTAAPEGGPQEAEGVTADDEKEAAGVAGVKRPAEEEAEGQPTKKKSKREQKKDRMALRDAHVAQQARFDRSRLCFKVAQGGECPYGEKCKFVHDIQAYLDNKEPDLGPSCVNFELFGECSFGLLCRYGNSHIKDGKNVIDPERKAHASPSKSINSLSHDTLTLLRRKKLDFPRTRAALGRLKKRQKQKAKASVADAGDEGPEAAETAGGEEADATATATAEAAVATAPAAAGEAAAAAGEEATDVCCAAVAEDDGREGAAGAGETEDTTWTEAQGEYRKLLAMDVPLRNVEKKQIDWKGKIYLAPLTTNGNLPFRRVCKNYGVDITCGEMALAQNIVKGQLPELALLKRHTSEDIFGVQIAGNFPDMMARCCELLSEMSIDFVDVNCGCPIDLVYNKGMGSALLERKARLGEIVTTMVDVLDVPVTVKLRTGVKKEHQTTHKIIPDLKAWGASAITLHGRTRQQRYAKLADWAYIERCAADAARVGLPIFGNGDVLSWEEAAQHMSSPNLSGIMVARGALVKPWIFTEIKERRHWDISSRERLDMLKDFVHFGLEHWGSDQQGVNNVRRFLLEWLSFLHRYVPIGLLEVLPQKMNHRPPTYFGRDELETLMASPVATDWVKITEMLLGPVPENFTFEAKHKANSYAADAEG